MMCPGASVEGLLVSEGAARLQMHQSEGKIANPTRQMEASRVKATLDYFRFIKKNLTKK